MPSKRILNFLLIAACILWIFTIIVVIILSLRTNWSTVLPAGGDGVSSSEAKSRWSSYKVLAVATDSEICSGVGRDIMVYQGGSVADAAIAAMLCLGLVNAQHCGIGGGFNAVIYDRPKNETGKIYIAVNARETVQSSFDPTSTAAGQLTSLVPGEIRGYYDVWKRFGRVSWSDLFQPAISLGRKGWNVSESMAVSIKSSLTNIRKDPGLSELLLKSDGTPYEAGEQMTNRKIAEVLQLIADQGPEVFYSGSVARDIALDLQELGMTNMTVDDLSKHRTIFSAPLVTELHQTGYNIYTTLPPSSGILTAFALKIMDGYNYTASDLRNSDALVLFYHRLVESWKIAFKESENLGDLGFNTSDKVEAWMSSFLSDGYVDSRRRLIKDDQVLDTSSLASALNYSGGTSGVCIMTADGSGVTATTTVGSLWGFKRRGMRTGIIFNDGITLFDLQSSTNNNVNSVRPLKHGRSSTSPLLLVDRNTKQIQMMHSAAGSQRIITSISFIASQILWRGMKPNEATDEPRVHHQGVPNELVYDNEMNKEIVEGLRRKGHLVKPLSSTLYPYLGVAQTIQVRACGSQCSDRLDLVAVSDRRKGYDAAPKGF